MTKEEQSEAKLRLIADIHDQAGEVEKAFAGSGFELVSKRVNNNRYDSPVYRWDVDTAKHKCVATVGCSSAYGRSGLHTRVWVTSNSRVGYERVRDTEYTTIDRAKNAKNALKRVREVAKRVTEARDEDRRQAEHKKKMKQLTGEELGDIEDVAAVTYAFHDKRPIQHLQRNEDGTYKVSLRGDLTLEQVRELLKILRKKS
jgi:hypothetical protein